MHNHLLLSQPCVPLNVYGVTQDAWILVQEGQSLAEILLLTRRSSFLWLKQLDRSTHSILWTKKWAGSVWPPRPNYKAISCLYSWPYTEDSFCIVGVLVVRSLCQAPSCSLWCEERTSWMDLLDALRQQILWQVCRAQQWPPSLPLSLFWSFHSFGPGSESDKSLCLIFLR